MEKKDIVEFLFKEKDIARQEVLFNIKAINQLTIILVPFIFAGIGVLVGDGTMSNVNNFKQFLKDWNVVLLEIIIQVLFLLWMYGLSVVSNIAALSGYMRALEEKINYFSDEKITEWESCIIIKYTNTFKSAQFISTLFWNLFYFVIFILLVIYAKMNGGNSILSIINYLETAIIVWVFILIIRTRKNSYNLTKLKLPIENK